MAEKQADTAVQEQPYSIRVEDAGPATKKVFVEIPREAVSAKIAQQFKELRQEAAIPGFRKGHAPQRLIEKKFSTDVKEQVRRALISESYEQAIKDNSLNVLGEPEIENPDQIKLAENEPLSYSFSVEIQPEIQLPELKGLKVKKPKITVTQEHIDQAMKNLSEQQGSLTPVEDRGVESGDFLTADVRIRCEGNEIAHEQDAQLVARPARIAGLEVAELDKQLQGAKRGDAKKISLQAPETAPNEAIRGKEVEIEISVKEIKRLQPAEINQEFLESLGFENQDQLRDALREQMEERIQFDIKSAMRRQVTDHLLASISIELPAKLSERQANRVVQRRAVDLMMRGMPRERIEQNVEKLRTGAADEAARELKSFFILQKVAEQENVDVSEGELNGRIYAIAIQQGQRPEKLKQEMSKDGSLMSLYIRMREEKAIDKLLESAEIEEVEPTAEQQKAVTDPEAESSAT